MIESDQKKDDKDSLQALFEIFIAWITVWGSLIHYSITAHSVAMSFPN